MTRNIQAVPPPASRPAPGVEAPFLQCKGHFFSLIAHPRQRSSSLYFSSPHPFFSNPQVRFEQLRSPVPESNR